MDLTVLSLIDTTVKIGLGALISGIATYATTRLKARHDSESEFRKTRRSLLERVSIAAHTIASIYTSIAHSLSQLGVHCDEDDAKLQSEARSGCIRANAELNMLQALTALLKDEALTAAVTRYASVVDALNDAALECTATTGYDKLQEFGRQANKELENVAKAIGEAFADAA